MSMEFCKRMYDRHWPGDDTAPIGATEGEIRAVEQRMEVTFPETYREFLLWMGNDHDGVLRDEYCFIKDIEDLTNSLSPWLQRNGIAPPKGKYVCCYSHLGHIYAWFLVPTDSEDPVLHIYNECDKSRPKPYVVGTFSDWIEEIMSSSTLDLWRQFHARQEYEAGLAAKNGGLNPDGTVYERKPASWRKKTEEARRQLREELEEEAKAKADAEAQATQSFPAQPT